MRTTIINILAIGLFCLVFMGCSKDRYIFTMKFIKLNSYHKSQYPSQNLSVRVINEANPNVVLAATESYPSTLPLPVTFSLNPKPEIHLYKEHITIQLWGDSTGFIASSTINMDDYKIKFPIDMETENENVSFSVLGSWE